jgi:DNA-binding CsgD family transcriptional regulator
VRAEEIERAFDAALGMLDQVACAAMLIDRCGRVLRRNDRADRLLGDGLKICRGAVVAADAQSNRDLQKLVDWVRTHARSEAALPPEPVVVRREDRHPLIVEARPVAGLAADSCGSATAVLAITDVAHRPPVPEELLRTVFGLTPAEARLAARLAGGESLEAAAEALGIAKNTARNQLKAVLAKTGTARQGELVALLARLGR